MEIITKQVEEVEIGTLKYGEVCRVASGRIFMKVASADYFKDDGFDTTIVNLEEGYIDRISHKARVRPIKLVAREV